MLHLGRGVRAIVLISSLFGLVSCMDGQPDAQQVSLDDAPSPPFSDRLSVVLPQCMTYLDSDSYSEQVLRNEGFSSTNLVPNGFSAPVGAPVQVGILNRVTQPYLGITFQKFIFIGASERGRRCSIIFGPSDGFETAFALGVLSFLREQGYATERRGRGKFFIRKPGKETLRVEMERDNPAFVGVRAVITQ